MTNFASCRYIPYNRNNANANLYNFCYEGGDWTIVHSETLTNSYHVEITNWDFDKINWTFPTIGAYGSLSYPIPEYVACFSAGYIQVILQFPENIEDTKSLYLNVSVENFKATSMSGSGVNQEQNINDNKSNTQIILRPSGNIQKYCGFGKKNGESMLWNNWGGGDAYTVKGNTISIRIDVTTGQNFDQVIYAMNILQKFDDSAFEIPNGSDESSFSGANSTQSILFAAKPDGSGWKNSDERDEAEEENLIYFSTIGELNQLRIYLCGCFI